MTVYKAINNAVASLKMEGYDIDDESIQHCKELLENKLTWEQYMEFIKYIITRTVTVYLCNWLKYASYCV